MKPLRRALRSSALASCLVAVVALSASAFATATQAGGDPLFKGKQTDGKREPTAPVERLAAWPEIPADRAATVKTDIERLRKAGTPEMAEQAETALVAAGAMVAPGLIVAMGKERMDDARLRLEAVLDQVTGAAHTRLLAPSFADKSREVRTWALARCAAFPDPGVLAEAEAAFAKASAAHAKDPKAEGSEAEVFAAALCATSAGSHKALETLGKVAVEQWGKRGVSMRLALEAVRDAESTKFATTLLAEADRKKKVAGLNLLAGCGTKDAIAAVKPYLDNTDNSIRIAAINAMRGIVDNDLPIANLPVFEAIELAKKWKERG